MKQEKHRHSVLHTKTPVSLVPFISAPSAGSSKIWEYCEGNMRSQETIKCYLFYTLLNVLIVPYYIARTFLSVGENFTELFS